MAGITWRLNVDSLLEKYSATHDHILESRPGESKGEFLVRFSDEWWRLATSEVYFAREAKDGEASNDGK